MSRFFADAARIFETAVQGGEANLGILLDHEGAIRIIASDGWRPDALQEHYGAQTVFQVTHTTTCVRVEARSGKYACLYSKELSGALIGQR